MKRRGAFTLIELLVVISVIAILLAILMPALQRVKKQARNTICQANLKQYGVAGRMYLDDNGYSFPYSFTWLYKDGGRSHRWHDSTKNLDAHPELGGEMWPYLKSQKIHLCPEFDVVARQVGGHSNESIPFEPQYSYEMNSYLNGDAWTAVPAQFRANIERIRKESQVKNLARVFFFSEENMWAIPGLSGAAVNDNNLRSTPAGNTDCFATYHNAPSGDLDLGFANAVFVDSHVEQVSARPRPNTFLLSWPGGAPIPTNW